MHRFYRETIGNSLKNRKSGPLLASPVSSMIQEKQREGQQVNKNNSKDGQFDPLGLYRLGIALEKVVDSTPGISEVNEAYAVVIRRYTALQDRYVLLKAANRQLAEEVAWLRDQCDDFALEIESTANPDVTDPDPRRDA
jgi:hypothetical protein